MLNKHVTHLATLARIGTKVRVVRNYSGVSASMPLSAFFSGFGSSEDANKAKKRKKKN